MSLHYFKTLIAVAEDCPVDHAVEPPGRGDAPTVAQLQHRMLRDHPHVYTQEDVLFDVWLQRQPSEVSAGQPRDRLREAFFAKPQACLRASPLPKQFGWGLLFDDSGRVALCARDSSRYRHIVEGQEADVRILRAMRNKRA